MKKDLRKLNIDGEQAIMDAVLFYESKGMAQPLPNAKAVLARYLDFRKYIQRGSMTVEQLQEKVYNIKDDGVTLEDVLRYYGSVRKLVQELQGYCSGADNGKAEENI
jgi:hypothetical protein